MNNFEISEMVSEKGKAIIVINGYKYNFHKVLAGSIKRWQCVQRGCKAFAKTLSVCNDVIECTNEHNHEVLVESTLNRQKVSNSVKRRAMDDLQEKPSKLIYSELTTTNIDTITEHDIRYIRNNIYNGRKQIVPKILQCIRDVHDVLNSKEVKTTQNEQFLLRHDPVANFIAFSSIPNLKFLTKLDTFYVDGTFKYSSKFFTQFFTIHALQNGHYIPVAFFLLPNQVAAPYKEALIFLKTECLKLNMHFNPKTIYADFEKSIHKVIYEVFPNAALKPQTTMMEKNYEGGLNYELL